MLKVFSGNKMQMLLIIAFGLFVLLALTDPALAGPIGKSGFEGKMSLLQDKFIGVILPLMSIFGLVTAGILAAIGNESAKGKIVFCVVGSAVGFLAPYIIGWIQALVN